MEYLITILGFITGGGLTAVVSARYIRKTSKIDAADKVVKFYEDQAVNLVNRLEGIDKRVKALEEMACSRKDCKDRITPIV